MFVCSFGEILILKLCALQAASTASADAYVDMKKWVIRWILTRTLKLRAVDKIRLKDQTKFLCKNTVLSYLILLTLFILKNNKSVGI